MAIVPHSPGEIPVPFPCWWKLAVRVDHGCARWTASQVIGAAGVLQAVLLLQVALGPEAIKVHSEGGAVPGSDLRDPVVSWITDVTSVISAARTVISWFTMRAR